MPISLSGSLNLSGSLTTTGTITATTLVVQTITSSISSITGSTNFGSLVTDTHKFTGSLLVSGSGTFTGSIGTTALNMNNMSALGSIGGGSIFLPSTATINFRSADGTTGYGSITADASSNLILNSKVGIGMTPDVNLQVKAISGNNTTFRIGPSASGFELNQDNGGFTVCTVKNIYATTNNAAELSLQSGFISFKTDTTLTERMRITSGGFTKMSNDGTYFGSTGTYHEMRSSIADFLGILTNTNSSAPNGLFIGYPNASPNNSDNLFLFCRDGGLTTRFKLQSNGGLANFQANNVNLSDERTKKEIFPLESYWDKFKAIEIVKFKYKDQTHDDFNIGVIAQQVESVAPEFIDIDGWGETPEDDIPLKSVYTADLHHATIKVLQEAMAKIEILEARVQELENK
jgi:hypothetical protein